MTTRVLFVCTANSARSIMAEAILRQLGGADFVAESAGTEPAQPDERALAALEKLGFTTSGLRSSRLAEFDGQQFDYIISLCDRTRHECQSRFASQNFLAWDFADPVAGNTLELFDRTALQLKERIEMFLRVLSHASDRGHLFDRPQSFFKIMADPLRLQMISLLAQHGELCVCDLVEATGMSQPKVSRHLAQLRDYGLLIDRKTARWVHYRINPALPDWMRHVINTVNDYNLNYQTAR
ncbi:metalloregulator ArsR/SmtB family transcription factor [Pseudidiomarina insulisalsae]|uniref:ArsR family transcriptional regulator n=1 Tax=Pseudidiomarina insulisalsae TaxID=575789 RepID=A0A432YRA8_9GAMM|nr:metalloregulator ArsR/SmtB family transcription factor [Pseudidiomarina insulisalsae]RUO63789.1 ArsR family transcriptional regulator [Pseudidiomarina insulisalsae]